MAGATHLHNGMQGVAAKNRTKTKAKKRKTASTIQHNNETTEQQATSTLVHMNKQNEKSTTAAIKP